MAPAIKRLCLPSAPHSVPSPLVCRSLPTRSIHLPRAGVATATIRRQRDAPRISVRRHRRSGQGESRPRKRLRRGVRQLLSDGSCGRSDDLQLVAVRNADRQRDGVWVRLHGPSPDGSPAAARRARDERSDRPDAEGRGELVRLEALVADDAGVVYWVSPRFGTGSTRPGVEKPVPPSQRMYHRDGHSDATQRVDPGAD